MIKDLNDIYFCTVCNKIMKQTVITLEGGGWSLGYVCYYCNPSKFDIHNPLNKLCKEYNRPYKNTDIKE